MDSALYSELELAIEMGKSYTEWLQLPKWERTLMFLFAVLRNLKSKHQYDKAKKESSSKAGKKPGDKQLSLKLVKKKH